MPPEWKVWLGVTFLISVATAFYMGMVVGAHMMAGKRVVLQQMPSTTNQIHCEGGFCWTGDIRPLGSSVGPHENDGYGIDR